jgi:glucose-6-phosphate isomerase
MESLTLNYKETCQVSEGDLKALETTLLPEVERINSARARAYASDYASINLPFDEELLKAVCARVKDKKSLSPTTLVVIGIGGSNLGTIAVLEALRGKFYNHDHDVKVYFVGTTDTDHVNDIAKLTEHELATGNNIILNVISKSGSTTETIANFEIFLEILKNHRPYNYHHFVVATTDENSSLWHLAQKEEFAVLTIPAQVGGRYSVFSAVGLFPLCFLEIDIKKLVEGARSGFAISTQTHLATNYAAISAALIAHHYRNGMIIHDTFLFSVALESVGAWYRQLSAESVGKSQTRDGDTINVGLLPTASMGSTDLHSVAQLYLAGPANRFTTFISVAHNASDLVLPTCPEFEEVVPAIQGKSLQAIMDAILQGTEKAYLHDKRPFVSWEIPEKSAYYIGQLMQIKMIEMMYLGFLLNVNPFDQPEVEKYKRETRSILASNNKQE